MTTRRIVADIGGTNARFAIADQGRYGDIFRVEVADYPSLYDALEAFLQTMPVSERPDAAAIDVAGPVQGDAIRLTNHEWSFSVAELKSRLGLKALRFFNDFAATAMAVPHLPAQDTFLVGPDLPVQKGPIGVIGPGTGLGMCSLLPVGGRWLPVPGEGGHVTLPICTDREAEIAAVLRRRWPHVSAERVLSGSGLVHLYNAVCQIEGVAPENLTPADVTNRAMKADPVCVQVFEHFCRILGTLASDLAVLMYATGGIYIAGGILLRFKEAFAASGFRQRFEDKGRFSALTKTVPTRLILEESPALLGLANADLNTVSQLS